MTIKERKILSIQYLRGLAALGVVFCHYGSGLASYPKLSSVFIFGKTGVDVFFLISGFIIVYSLVTHNYKSNQFFTFLLKRSIRIDPAYYVTVILVFVLWRVIYKITGFEGDRIDFIPQQFWRIYCISSRLPNILFTTIFFGRFLSNFNFTC